MFWTSFTAFTLLAKVYLANTEPRRTKTFSFVAENLNIGTENADFFPSEE